MKKVCLVAFNGERMCFVHVLLNALEMHEKGWKVKIVIEGSATKLAVQLNNEAAQFGRLFLQVKELGLIDCICKACSSTMGVLDQIENLGYKVCGDMYGHPSMYKFIQAGYEVYTF